MAERLKDRFFTKESVEAFSQVMKKHHSDFDADAFVAVVSSEEFQALELMQMARKATEYLAELLPDTFADAVEILSRVAPDARGFEVFCLPTFVELYGLEDWDTSLPALALFTRYASSEFAIRPFILADPERAMASWKS